MAINDVAGFFSLDSGRNDGRNPTWRVSASDWLIANRVSSLLGGLARADSSVAGQAWIIDAQANSFPVILEAGSGRGVYFRLAGDRSLGVFELCSRSSMLRSVLESEFDTLAVNRIYKLSIRAFDFVTANGAVIRYSRPLFLNLDA